LELGNKKFLSRYKSLANKKKKGRGGGGGGGEGGSKNFEGGYYENDF